MAPKATTDDSSLSGHAAIAIIGAGSIGAAFALMFASGGCKVRVYDSSEEQGRRALQHIGDSLRDLEEFGLTRQTAGQVMSQIDVVADIADAVQGADYVQECVPEDIALKQSLFARLDKLVSPDTILASASSAITASEIAASLAGAHRCIIAHPGNPPFLIRVVEVVPAPFTSPEVTERTANVLRSAGLHPVILRKEMRGFVFNRLQGAMLREAYSLVEDGVASVEDIDVLVRDGLGLRWAVVGPFETADLNRRGGIGKHAEIMGPAYAAMGAERGACNNWSAELVSRVAAERRALLPLAQWDERVRWRDRQLMALLATRLNSNK